MENTGLESHNLGSPDKGIETEIHQRIKDCKNMTYTVDSDLKAAFDMVSGSQSIVKIPKHLDSKL